MKKSNEYEKGASSSIRKTIKEIEKSLNKEKVVSSGKLRGELHDALNKLSKKWYKKGFNRGHKESYSKYEEIGRVPKSLEYESKRDFFDGKKTITLTSRIKKRKTISK